MTKDEITAILDVCRAHWAEHGTSVPDAALEALELHLEAFKHTLEASWIISTGIEAAEIYDELQRHSKHLTADELKAETRRKIASWQPYLNLVKKKYLQDEEARHELRDDGSGFYKRMPTRPNKYTKQLDFTRIRSAVKTAAAQAAAGQQDVLPNQPDAPKQWMIACFYRYLQENDYPTPYSDNETKTAAYAEIGEKWGCSPNNVKNWQEKTITPKQRQPLLQGGLQTGRTKELLEMLAPHPNALAQCRKEAGLTDDKAKP